MTTTPEPSVTVLDQSLFVTEDKTAFDELAIDLPAPAEAKAVARLESKFSVAATLEESLMRDPIIADGIVLLPRELDWVCSSEVEESSASLLVLFFADCVLDRKSVV